MHFSIAYFLPFLSSFSKSAVLPTTQQPLADSTASPYGFRIPTVHESTVMARRMLHLEGIGTLSTIFPSSSHSDPLHTKENRPERVAHAPFGLPEYIADCEPHTGNPTILQVDIANTFRNVRAGSNVTLSIAWHPPGKLDNEYSAAKMPRYALLGWLQEMELSEKEEKKVRECFLKRHPDVIWAPGSDIHESRWVRFMVEEFYWFGGFGDRSRIQWIDTEEWRGVTTKEIEKMRLPGEKGGDGDVDVDVISSEL